MSQITTRTLDCGCQLVAQTIPNVASAAVSWYLPVGSSTDDADGDGLATMLSDAFDRLGVQRNARVLRHHLMLGTIMLADRVTDAVGLTMDMVRRPMLPADAVDPVRSLCLQSLEALDDDPQQLVGLNLREHHFPAPFNRHGYGTAGVVEAADVATLRGTWSQRCRPGGTIIAAAGGIDPDALARQLDAGFDGWSGAAPAPVVTAPADRGAHHHRNETAQMHLALAFDAPAAADEQAMLERLGIAVLGGSTSGRLFTEVRQKRSLCYSVGASYEADRDFGAVTLYAGTTPQRAAETLDVCRAEIDRLGAGVTQAEFARAVVGLKSRLVMHGESTPARAVMLASDLFRRGRARSLDEVATEIDAITLDALNAYLAERTPGPITIATIGPEPLPRAADAAIATSDSVS
jgi:predicted Zn-dependent peptidase